MYFPSLQILRVRLYLETIGVPTPSQSIGLDRRTRRVYHTCIKRHVYIFCICRTDLFTMHVFYWSPHTQRDATSVLILVFETVAPCTGPGKKAPAFLSSQQLGAKPKLRFPALPSPFSTREKVILTG